MPRKADSKKAAITKTVLELLSKAPEGIRFAALHKEISGRYSSVSFNTITGILVALESNNPGRITRPERGLFKLVESIKESTKKERKAGTFKEEDFYESFANYLIMELAECTKAVALGGNRFRQKWGTPDVMGIWRNEPDAMIKLPEEIVSAEIKSSEDSLITAFGQACSYKLFSHKVYIVVPKSAPQDDIDRLDSLCLIFGIGFVLFDSTNPANPGFEIRSRALRHSPDMFYVNRNLREVKRELFM